MFFLQAAQAPMPVQIDKDRKALVPLFLLDDAIDWCGELVRERSAAALEMLDEEQQAQFLSLFPISAPDIQELRRLVTTPQGSRFIVRRQLLKAKVQDVKTDAGLADLSEEEVDAIIALQPATRLVNLGFNLGQFSDTSTVNPFKDADEEAEKAKNPLGKPKKPA